MLQFVPSRPDEFDIACRHFKLGKILSASPAGGTRNASWFIAASNGKYVLRKRFDGYSADNRIKYDHGVIRHLLAGGVPVAPLVAASDGTTAWTAPDGGVWEAYLFVPGKHLNAGEENALVGLGTALFAFHCQGASFGSYYDKLDPRGETSPHRLFPLLEKLEAEDMRLAVLPFKRLLLEAADALDDTTFSLLPETLVHGDIQPGNIITDNRSKVKAFVDLDWCCRRPRIYDLAFAILMCCGRKIDSGAGELWDLTATPVLSEPLIETFLNAYLADAPPLNLFEAKALIPQINLTWCHVRLANSLKVPAGQRREFITRNPELNVIPAIEAIGKRMALNKVRLSSSPVKVH